MNVLFATWELFWLELREWFLFPFYHPVYPNDNKRLDYEMAQCISNLFWPVMKMPEDKV